MKFDMPLNKETKGRYTVWNGWIVFKITKKINKQTNKQLTLSDIFTKFKWKYLCILYPVGQ